jgi:Zn-dependent M28 family amino/carboxypeptidase
LRRVALLVVAALALIPSSAQAGDRYNSKPYRDLVTVPGMVQHEQALQSIADANNGTRVAGSPGNDQTVDYIYNTMSALPGWTVRKQPFDFPFFQETASPSFEQTAPVPKPFTENTDFLTMSYSGSGDVTGNVTAVGPLNVPIGDTPPGTTTSGCDPQDFATFPRGDIALIQRGSCNFSVKAHNAEDAGAIGVVIFNEGQPGRTDPTAGNLGEPFTVPIIGATYQLGVDTLEALKNGPVTFHIVTHTISETRTTYNVIADSPYGNPDRTVVISAHNDSVGAGPGINDDGSGTSMDLELARHLGEHGQKPRNHVRFIWVGAEEEGLLGSTYYVSQLSDQEKSQIIAMLDFDMVASPNWARQIYDGDGSTFGSDVSGPNGSGFIEGLFSAWFDSQGQAHEPIPFDGRSDYVAFTDAGIPAGGTFTGAEQPKTAEEQALFGGTVGEALDPCYHQACDTINNLNLTVFGQMKDAAADVLYQLMLTRNAIVDGSSIKHGKKLKNPGFVGETAAK